MGMHYVPLVDAGISAGEIPGSYPPYDLGIEMDVFVKNVSKQPFIGKVSFFFIRYIFIVIFLCLCWIINK